MLRLVDLPLSGILLLRDFLKKFDPFLLHLNGRVSVRGIVGVSILQRFWAVAALIEIRANEGLKPLFDLGPEVVDDLHILALNQNSLKHVEAVLVLDQYFE